VGSVREHLAADWYGDIVVSRKIEARLESVAASVVEELERRQDIIDDLRSQLSAYKPGNGTMADELSRLPQAAFEDEVGDDRCELFDKLMPMMWPDCITRYSMTPKRGDIARAVKCIIDDSEPEMIATDIARLTALRDFIDAVIKRATRP
jgi:hypothetical protein